MCPLGALLQVATAVLSVTAKAKARAQKKEADKMEVESTGGQAKEDLPPPPPPQLDEEEKTEPVKEPEFSILENPARVLMQQVGGLITGSSPGVSAAVSYVCSL